jgi:hypothetical protein
MVRAVSSPDPIAEVRRYLQGVAKSLVDRLFGPEGPAWGTTLSSLEATIASVRTALSEQMLTLALSRQSAACSAQAQTESVRCPGCQSPTQTNDPESRVVSTAVGWAHWSEPYYFCPKCRKAFFPSVGQPRP